MALALWLAFRGPWDELGGRLGDARWLPILGAIALNFLVFMPVRALRWRMAMQDPPPLLTILASMLEGNTVGALFGTTAGDLVRSTRLRGTASFARDYGSTLAERACEYLALTLMVGGVAVAGQVPIGWLAAPGIAILVMMAIVRWHDDVARRLNRFPRVRTGLESLGGALTLRRVAAMTGLAFLGWSAEVLMIHLVLGALDLPSGAGLATLVVVFINVFTMVPGVPGNLGTFEGGVTLALATGGVAQEAALSFALFYHAMHMIPSLTVGGLVWLIRGSRNLPDR